MPTTAQQKIVTANTNLAAKVIKAIASQLPKGALVKTASVRTTLRHPNLQAKGTVVSCFARLNTVHILLPGPGALMGIVHTDRVGNPVITINRNAKTQAQILAQAKKVGQQIASVYKKAKQ